MEVSLKNIIGVYDEVCKSTKNKKRLFYFEKNKMINCYEIYDKLTNKYDGIMMVL